MGRNNRVVRKGKALGDEGLFPIALRGDEEGCSAEVDIDLENQVFTLTINEVFFNDLP